MMAQADTQIQPHGGLLVKRSVEENSSRRHLRERCPGLSSITVDTTAEADLELLGNGGYSPLTGFMGQADFDSVLDHMRLASGLPWPIPVVVGVSAEAAAGLSAGQLVALRNGDGRVLGTMQVEEWFPHDAAAHARAVYGTDSPDHPGVGRVLGLGEMLVSGPVEVLGAEDADDHQQYRLTPRQVRAEFARRGWSTAVAFQTRNPIHRAHEYLMKCALESTDGLLLHPIVGQTKADDLSADIRIRSYEVLLERYFSPHSAMMSLFPAAMRYAGPREAVFHAIVRKNYGCTHFIVGRDHAGARSPDGQPYYDPLAAQEIFSRFAPGELGIELFLYDNAFYCRQCEAIVTEKTAPASTENRFSLSGTAVRALLRSGQRPPPEITRPEVADVLIEALADQKAREEAALGRFL